MTRLAVLGGSAVSTPQLAAAAATAGLDDLHLALVGRSAEKLSLVAEACRRAGGGAIGVSEHTEPEPALDGVDLILCQVRVGGLEGRAFDERYGRDLGIPGEETVGPGGFALAWRTLPVLRELLETCRRVAPNALLLNLTNPAAMVHRLASDYLRTITLCDAPLVLAQKVAALVGQDAARAELRYVGLNHCGWITRLRVGGDDVLHGALDLPIELERLTGVDAEITSALGVVPNPYLRYLYHPDRQLAAQNERVLVRAQELQTLERQALDDYVGGADLAAVAARRPAPWYSESVVPLVGAHGTGGPLRTIVNLTNGKTLPFLPAQATVEVAVEIAGGEVTPLTVDPLPPDAQSILGSVAAFDILAGDGVLAGDRVTCVRALSAHPLVPSVDVARELVARVEKQFGPLVVQSR